MLLSVWGVTAAKERLPERGVVNIPLSYIVARVERISRSFGVSNSRRSAVL